MNGKQAVMLAVAALAWPGGLCAARPDPVQQAAVLTYARMVEANYQDCLTAAKTLETRVQELIEQPSAETLAAARQAWLAGRTPYLQSEAYRYYAGPIDDADGPETLLNSWPLDELYLDAGEGGDGGLIGNVRACPEITPQVIESLNLRDGEKNISCGWHAIEFLLWGQDHSDTGPGDRPYTDYTTAPHAKRRGEWLAACAALMVANFEDMVQQWAPDKLGNYRAVFEEGVEFSIERMLSGVVFLSGNELAGARLQVAYDTQEQEEEHSCFSDNSHNDAIGDAVGIQNVWRGHYVRTDGTRIEGKGLRDVALAAAPELVPGLDEKIDATVARAREIPVPFDQAIKGTDDSPGRKAVWAAILSAEDQANLLRQLAHRLKVEIPEEIPTDVAG